MDDEIADLKLQIAELKHVKELVLSKGWKVIKKHFDHVIVTITDALDVEEDFKKIKRLQERKRAFKSMLETVESLCEHHSQILLQLEDMENENNEREQYGQ